MGEAHAFDFLGVVDVVVLPATTNSPSNFGLVECPNKDVWVKADYLGTKFRQLKQLNKDVEIGYRSSGMCDLPIQGYSTLPFRH
ncbi:hypothetical protein [Paraglaciecola sp. L3A3]|uniref:hypothetical protein n=1 Tax=Paraglaciecola sp. L3A3 TaxID=2686358 RepID=UPI00131C0204|nr:hypothetical protein [Paraglaciecola sp. L3A3]